MQSIEGNKSEHPTGTLATTFHKPTGEENLYVWFGYGPQKICNHTRGQVLVSTNADLVNAKKRSKINKVRMITKTLNNNA